MSHQFHAAARTGAILALALSAACELQPFAATRTEHYREPVSGIGNIVCTSRNGGIELRGVPGADGIGVETVITARGATEAAAEDHMKMLRVGIERRDGGLAIEGIVPSDFDSDWSASFEFRITAPPELVARLVSHNGGLSVDAMAGDLEATTHNGGIRVDASSHRLELSSHNGGVVVACRGEGPVEGSIRSHNGGVRVALGERTAVVAADSHNGGVSFTAAMVVKQRGERSLVAEKGQGGGDLVVESHNGGVDIR